jgi:hypothetical protein
MSDFIEALKAHPHKALGKIRSTNPVRPPDLSWSREHTKHNTCRWLQVLKDIWNAVPEEYRRGQEMPQRGEL